MRKSSLVTIILLIYLAVMSYIGWTTFSDEGNYLEYCAIILITIIVIFFLRYLLRKKENKKMEYRKMQDASQRRHYRNDDIH